MTIKVITIVGTRPEIIRLAPTIKLLDRTVEHVLVHTGQNYDYALNEIFFEDLGIRRPDHFLQADTSSLGSSLGSIIQKTETVLIDEKPDAFLILGDTNSAISAVIAKRLKIPVFHMEAGNRSFDENVPEEINRRMIDHISDYNLVYTEHARRNLLAEGIHPSRILLTGSPMWEVLNQNRAQIDGSDAVARMSLKSGEYFLVSLHREENVDVPDRLEAAVAALHTISAAYGLPVVVSTHPRTRKRLEALGIDESDSVRFQPPFGFHDYCKLQLEAKVVLSDSGTISEEAAILGFPAITLRDFIERPEAIDAGGIITSGVEPERVLDAVGLLLAQPRPTQIPADYLVENTSQRVVNFIQGAVPSHRRRLGLLTTVN